MTSICFYFQVHQPFRLRRYGIFDIDRSEFDRQVDMHRELIERHFGAVPVVFRNTELLFNDDLARHLAARGFPSGAGEGGRLFRTPGEVAEVHAPVAELDVPHFTSWADLERDLSAWLGNPMQHAAAKALYDLDPTVRTSADDALVRRAQVLQPVRESLRSVHRLHERAERPRAAHRRRARGRPVPEFRRGAGCRDSWT